MALQYARRMGFRVVAIGRGGDIVEDALALGAHRYLDSQVEDAVGVLKGLGGAKAIVATAGHAAMVSALMGALAPTGRRVLLGGGKDPLLIPIGPIVVGERSVLGSITGTPYDNERMLDFSVLAGVRPRFEVMPLEQALAACQRTRSVDAKLRMVLRMACGPGAPQGRSSADSTMSLRSAPAPGSSSSDA